MASIETKYEIHSQCEYNLHKKDGLLFPTAPAISLCY